MKRHPYSKGRDETHNNEFRKDGFLGNPDEWISSRDLAIRLRKFTKDGKPSLGAIRTMVYRKQVAGKKFFGRLMFPINEILRLITASPPIGG